MNTKTGTRCVQAPCHSGYTHHDAQEVFTRLPGADDPIAVSLMW